MIDAALLFPGQGAQSAGMGRHVFDSSPAAQDVFKRADNAAGFSVSALCFDGPEEQLRLTAFQQPAILTVSLAILAAADAMAQAIPTIATGHSLGLYTAAVSAGVLSLEDGVRLVAQRGTAMQEAADATPGSMVAVLGLLDETVEEVCLMVSSDAEPVVAANYNAPGQIVISGATTAVLNARAILKERGARRLVELPVAGAFHSPLMNTAVEVMRPILESTAMNDPRYPLVANSSPRVLRTADDVREELLRGIAMPVRWIEGLVCLLRTGVRHIIDVGPSGTLANLAKKIVPLVGETEMNEIRVERLDE